MNARQLRQAPLFRWLAGAAALAALGLGAVATAVLIDSPAASHAQVVGNLDVRTLYVEKVGDEQFQIMVVDAPGQQPRAFGSPARFSTARFSPDGAVVAGLAPTHAAGADAALHLIKAGGETVVNFPATAASSAIAWSPTGNIVAVVGTMTYLVNSDGKVLATADGPNRSDGGGVSLMSGGYDWSPDGSYFVALVNGDLLVLRPDGSYSRTPGNDLASGAADDLFIEGWIANEGPLLTHSGNQVVAAVRGVEVTAGSVNGRLVTPPAGLKGASAEARARAQAAVSGGKVVWSRMSADGTALIAEVRDSAGNGRVVTVLDGDTSRKVELTGFDLQMSRGGGLLDAAVRR